MDIDVKVVSTRAVTLTLTEEEARTLFALATYHPLTAESSTDSFNDFKSLIRVSLVKKLGRFPDMNREDYIESSY